MDGNKLALVVGSVVLCGITGALAKSFTETERYGANGILYDAAAISLGVLSLSFGLVGFGLVGFGAINLLDNRD